VDALLYAGFNTICPQHVSICGTVNLWRV
jgi:hypothetical protein